MHYPKVSTLVLRIRSSTRFMVHCLRKDLGNIPDSKQGIGSQ
jgi:hypothetical protein